MLINSRNKHMCRIEKNGGGTTVTEERRRKRGGEEQGNAKRKGVEEESSRSFNRSNRVESILSLPHSMIRY
jgi:hypothetical protein